MTGTTWRLTLRKRRERHPTPVFINGEEMKMVETYKFLGEHLNNKLDCSSNAEAISKKGESRLFFLWRLRSFTR